MSADVFQDIWQKLSDIYTRIGVASGPASSGGGSTSGIGGIFARVSKIVQEKTAKLLSTASLVKFAKIAGISTLLVSGFSALAKAVDLATETYLESMRKYSKVNADLAKSFALSDIADFFRDAKFAQGTAGTTGSLNEAYTALKDAFLPLQIVVTNLFNRVLTVLNKILAPIVRVFGNLVSGIAGVIGGAFDGVVSAMTYAADKIAGTTDEEKRAREADQRTKDRQNASQLQFPVERFFNAVARRDWKSVTDSRQPLF